MSKIKLLQTILLEKLKPNPNRKLIQKLQQLVDKYSVKKKMYTREARKQVVRDFHQIVDDTWDEEDVENWIQENL